MGRALHLHTLCVCVRKTTARGSFPFCLLLLVLLRVRGLLPLLILVLILLVITSLLWSRGMQVVDVDCTAAPAVAGHIINLICTSSPPSLSTTTTPRTERNSFVCASMISSGSGSGSRNSRDTDNISLRLQHHQPSVCRKARCYIRSLLTLWTRAGAHLHGVEEIGQQLLGESNFATHWPYIYVRGSNAAVTHNDDDDATAGEQTCVVCDQLWTNIFCEQQQKQQLQKQQHLATERDSLWRPYDATPPATTKYSKSLMELMDETATGITSAPPPVPAAATTTTNRSRSRRRKPDVPNKAQQHLVVVVDDDESRRAASPNAAVDTMASITNENDNEDHDDGHVRGEDTNSVVEQQDIDMSENGDFNKSSPQSPPPTMEHGVNAAEQKNGENENIDENETSASNWKRLVVGKSTKRRKNYSPESLEKAIDAVCNGKLGTRRAAIVYGIPRSTLRNKLNKILPHVNRNNNNNAPTASSSSMTTNSKEGAHPTTPVDSAPAPDKHDLRAALEDLHSPKAIKSGSAESDPTKIAPSQAGNTRKRYRRPAAAAAAVSANNQQHQETENKNFSSSISATLLRQQLNEQQQQQHHFSHSGPAAIWPLVGLGTSSSLSSETPSMPFSHNLLFPPPSSLAHNNLSLGGGGTGGHTASELNRLILSSLQQHGHNNIGGGNADTLFATPTAAAAAAAAYGVSPFSSLSSFGAPLTSAMQHHHQPTPPGSSAGSSTTAAAFEREGRGASFVVPIPTTATAAGNLPDWSSLSWLSRCLHQSGGSAAAATQQPNELTRPLSHSSAASHLARPTAALPYQPHQLTAVSQSPAQFLSPHHMQLQQQQQQQSAADWHSALAWHQHQQQQQHQHHQLMSATLPHSSSSTADQPQQQAYNMSSVIGQAMVTVAKYLLSAARGGPNVPQNNAGGDGAGGSESSGMPNLFGAAMMQAAGLSAGGNNNSSTSSSPANTMALAMVLASTMMQQQQQQQPVAGATGHSTIVGDNKNLTGFKSTTRGVTSVEYANSTAGATSASSTTSTAKRRRRPAAPPRILPAATAVSTPPPPPTSSKTNKKARRLQPTTNHHQRSSPLSNFSSSSSSSTLSFSARRAEQMTTTKNSSVTPPVLAHADLLLQPLAVAHHRQVEGNNSNNDEEDDDDEGHVVEVDERRRRSRSPSLPSTPPPPTEEVTTSMI